MLEQITEQQLAENGVVSAPDKLEGDPKDNKAIFDRLITQLVARVVNQIIEAHNALDVGVNRRIDAVMDELRNHVDVDPGNITAQNVGLLRKLADKFGLADKLAPTVHDALEVLDERNITQAAAVRGLDTVLRGLIGERALVESGSYTGTGTFGEEYPNMLTFAFEPKVLILTEESRGCYNNGKWLFSQEIGIWVDGVTQDSVYSGSYGSKYRYWTRDGNMLSWYSEAYDSSADGIAASPSSQFNASGTGYRYVAIG